MPGSIRGMTNRFSKYHGLGNDFILVDMRGRGDIPADITQQVCSRRTGVGADGILGLYDTDGVRMRVFNSDGSIADMCGNGLRCFVAWLINDLGYPCEPMTVLTDAGPQHCIPTANAEQRITAVTVNLGPAKFAKDTSLESGGRHYTGTPMTLGNPHFVILRAPEEGEVEEHGPALSVHSEFSAGANIEWMHVIDDQNAELVVYERGAGLTLACGTGGGGAAATAVMKGLLTADEELSVRLPGGMLRYRVASDFSEVWMTGPIVHVYSGELAIRL